MLQGLQDTRGHWPICPSVPRLQPLKGHRPYHANHSRGSIDRNQTLLPHADLSSESRALRNLHGSAASSADAYQPSRVGARRFDGVDNGIDVVEKAVSALGCTLQRRVPAPSPVRIAYRFHTILLLLARPPLSSPPLLVRTAEIDRVRSRRFCTFATISAVCDPVASVTVRFCPLDSVDVVCRSSGSSRRRSSDSEYPFSESFMCGILGLILAEGVSPGALPVMAVDGLTALQHRGTESSGLVGSDGIHRNQFSAILKGSGLVRDVYSSESLARFKDSVAMIGHNRYSTAGMKDAINCIQPFVVHTAAGIIAVAHNGELVDKDKTRQEVLAQGTGLSTDTDSELIGQLISKAIALNMKTRTAKDDFGNIEKELAKELAVAMAEIRTSYSVVVMTYDRIYALRDPYGNRPLSIGTLYSNSAVVNGAKREPLGYMAVSETCALPASAKFTCDVKPGEIVEISRRGIRSVVQMAPQKASFCIFEYVYFARADSHLEGQQVHAVRALCGRILAEEAPTDADIVSTVPESAAAASLGYAAQSGIKYEQVLHRNSYVGRSFIQPNTELRQSAIHKKFGVLRHNVEGKRVVLVDDSIVRGNTMGIIVRLLKENGAKEVHIRIASPPVK
uniref:Glutamine amidotransferase type-2 domain-containing protein n=1 Tax=Steinernema glaseri TaxID=37863 RepID=A0A1I7Z583_9BILA